ncbi:ATP-binding protein [Streptomyces bacillaris]|uniref:ATP-binding protein n=1 Tax=Streptomyces bacillaris TaxID=68179 RepID=UPI003822147D
MAAVRGGSPVALKSAKAVELLAVLLLAPGYRASHAGIMRFLWPDQEPNANRIRQYFHHLRESIPEVVRPNDRGFCQIHVSPGDVDYGRFLGFRQAANAFENPATRLKELRSALAEWHGTPLEDLPGPEFEQKRTELITEHRNAVADCVLAELESGEAHAALERADWALARWPEYEKLVRLKMRCLVDLGRHDQVEPLLADWERRSGRPAVRLLLNSGARPGNAPPDGPPAGAVPARPRQLPMHQPTLIGRQVQVERIFSTLLGRTPGRNRIAVLTGLPGVGKTALAMGAASLIDKYFPDGILYVDLGGFSPGEPLRHGAVLARFLNDLGVRPSTPTMDGMVSAYLTALANRSVLLILDNARDEEHVRPLLPGPGTSAAIVTSRRRMHGLTIRQAADNIDLAPLGGEEAAELLRDRLGDDGMGAVLPFVDDVVKHCGGLPFALSIMAARIVARPRALAGVVRELREARTRLSSLDLGSENLSMSLLLDNSCRQLSAPAARFLRHLAVLPGPSISWEALRALEPEDVTGASNAFDELVRMSLVIEHDSGRYELHDLVRVHVGESAHRLHGEEGARVIERTLRFLLHQAWACDRKLAPNRALPVGAAPDLQVAAPATALDAMVWFETEYPTLTSAVELAAKYGLHRYTWLLPMVLVTFQWRSGRHLDALTYLGQALEAADRVARPADMAMVHRMLGGTYRSLADLPRATGELRRAVQISKDDGDILGAALGRHVLGVLLRESGVPGEALEHFTKALSDFERLDDPLGQGAALNGIGCARYDLGQYEAGLEYCRRSLVLLEGTDDVNSLAHLLFSVGRIRLAMGNLEAALADFGRARDLYATLTYASREARTLVWLADTLRGADRIGEADEAISRARTLLRESGEGDLDMAVEKMRCLP